METLKSKNRWVGLFSGSALLLLTAPALLAQDEEVENTTLFDQIMEAGVWMWPLYLCSVIMVALYVFNFMQLTKAKFCPAGLEAALLEHMQACRARSAI